MTVALRGSPVKRADSPKKAPSPSVANERVSPALSPHLDAAAADQVELVALVPLGHDHRPAACFSSFILSATSVRVRGVRC